MKIHGTKDIQGVDRPQAPKERTPASVSEERPPDKVTIEAPQVAELLSTARQRTQATRQGRLKELEAALRDGSYRPDVGQLAEKLLSAAEVDARLRAMMRS
ncbi:MAG TPA: flagellar biosynthesis anti-sigma factor FlgM [Polyangia bacterium]